MSRRNKVTTRRQQVEKLCKDCLAEAVKIYIRQANRKELESIIGAASIELHNPFLPDEADDDD